MIKPEEKAVVLARLTQMAEGITISIGGSGSYDKWDIINHVEKEDDVGELMVEMEMLLLRSFKDLTKYKEPIPA